MASFIEYNKERREALAKLSGIERENYLIELVNELTIELEHYRKKIAKIHEDLDDDFFAHVTY